MLLASCNSLTPLPVDVEKTLEAAGNNSTELLKVIDHYQDDTLKRDAALFLIGNMRQRYTLYSEDFCKYYNFLDSIYQVKQEEYDIPALCESFVKSTKVKINDIQPVAKPDCEFITADYLIRNIDEAFNVWDKPWNKHLSFSDFCEFILPYRYETEELDDWRTLFKEKYAQALKSDSICNAITACNAINSMMQQDSVKIYPNSILPVNLRVSTLAKMRFGLCSDCAMLATLAMRSWGIPVSQCVVPHWGQKNSSHTFNVVLNNDGMLYDFLGTETKTNEHLKLFHENVPKLYMRTFGKQPSSLALLHGEEPIPAFFMNPYIKDITSELPNVYTKSIALPINYKTGNKYAYLCVFDISGWTPVAWGTIRNKKASFYNVGTDEVYHLAVFENDSIKLTGNPFYLERNGKIRYYTPQKEVFDIILERKYPGFFSWEEVSQKLIGGQFQGASTKDFHDAVTFHTIKECPQLKYANIYIENASPVKYVRYISNGHSEGNMGEIEFYEKGNPKPLKGKFFGEYKQSKFYPRNGIEMLFDGDPLTFFHCGDSTNWGALEFNEPVKINKIRYVMRNDDNGIRKGHIYELFYMNNGVWVSLGKQKADKDDEILYMNLPKNALYWLRDYTKGHEERIFEINNKKQIIWR